MSEMSECPLCRSTTECDCGIAGTGIDYKSQLSQAQAEIAALSENLDVSNKAAVELEAEIAELKADNKKYKSQLIIEKLAEVENLIDVNNQLKKELRLERECVDDFILEQDHASDCRRSMPAEVCECMDRRYYNYDGCLERARQRQANRKILTDKDR